MSNQYLQSMSCPGCGSPIDLRKQSTHGAYVACDACGSEFVLQGHVCPYCGTYHQQEVDHCRRCGAGLSRRCPQCTTVNWIGDEYCAHCGAPLDILELIVQRHNQDTKDRLYQQMDESQKVREAEVAASQARYNRMLAQEHAEQAALRQRILEQKQKEKKVLSIVLGIAAVIVVLIIVLTIVAG